MKVVLGAPTYSLGEILMQESPELPENIYGSKMKDWIQRMGNTKPTEYYQRGIIDTLVGNLNNNINNVLDTIQ